MNESDYETDNYDLVNCKNYLIFRLLFDYGSKLSHCILIIALTLTTIVFYRILINSNTNQNNNGQIFKYFFLKSISDLGVFLSQFFEIFYFYNDDKVCDSYIWQVWFIWIYYYSYYFLVSISNWMEIGATMDCYLLIKNKFKFLLTTKSFYSIMMSSVVFNTFINIHYIFRFEIVNTINSTNQSYEIMETTYNTKEYYVIINYMIVAYRDGLPMILLLILNGFILILFKNVLARKRRMQGNTNSDRTIETNKLKLILSISLSFIVLRMPYVIKQLPFHNNNKFWTCYYYPASIRLYDLSFLIAIINYYCFNKKFRYYFKMTIKLRRVGNDQQLTMLSFIKPSRVIRPL
jgi:hypothetical protein